MDMEKPKPNDLLQQSKNAYTLQPRNFLFVHANAPSLMRLVQLGIFPMRAKNARYPSHPLHAERRPCSNCLTQSFSMVYAVEVDMCVSSWYILCQSYHRREQVLEPCKPRANSLRALSKALLIRLRVFSRRSLPILFQIVLHRVRRSHQRTPFRGSREDNVVQDIIPGVLGQSFTKFLGQGPSFDAGVLAVFLDDGTHGHVVHLAPASDDAAGTMLLVG